MKDVTLVFLRRPGEVLLAMKKRGFGEGKWNGMGGKVEPGETIEAAALRECREEVCVTPKNIIKLGELDFFFSHDPSFGHCAHIFTATEWDGELTETEEMRPQWFPVRKIPYHAMWADDPQWLPLLITGKTFTGAFTLGPNGEVVHADLVETPPGKW